MRCPICQHKGRSGSEVHGLRHRDYLGCVINDFLSETSHTNICDHSSTNFDSINSLTELFNDAGNFTARYKREWRLSLIFSLYDQCIREIHTTRLHANNHLAFPRFKWLDIFDYKTLWRCECLTYHCFHEAVPPVKLFGSGFCSCLSHQL